MHHSAITARFASRRAFTLIELLVVITIIAILVGITIPALGNARETSRRTVCLTNLRSFGQGLEGYYRDYSVLPGVRPLHDGTNTGGGGNDPSLFDTMAAYIDAPIPERENPADPNSPFTKVSDMFKCPSDRTSSDAASNFQPVWRTTGISYEYFAGSIMFGAEMAAVDPKVIASAVTKVYEQAQWRELPVMFCYSEWHKLRKNGPGKNALYFGDWRADWCSSLGTVDLRSDAGRRLICDVVKRFGGIPLPGCD
jgi:prepilin-type N-terminal cleavage/methylation domain-containing protein